MPSAITSPQDTSKKTPSTVLKSIVTPRFGSGNQHEHKKSTLAAPLGEIHHNCERPGPSRSPVQPMDKARLLHRRSKTEFRAIVSQEKEKTISQPETKLGSPKKTKSSTNLAALLGKSRSKSKDNQADIKNKENQAPKSADSAVSPPIWAQFSSQTTTQVTKIVLSDAHVTGQEVKRYTTQDTLPPTTSNLPAHVSPYKPQGIRVPLKAPANDGPTSPIKTNGLLRKNSSSRSIKDRAIEVVNRGQDRVARPPTSDGVPSRTTRGQSRVRAAVAALSGKDKQPVVPLKTVEPTPVDIDAKFEEMLEARNIAPEVREKMRSLEKHVKADLIKQNNAAPAQFDSSSAGSRASSRPGTSSRTNTSESIPSVKTETTETTEKKARPRSFTGFTLSKGGSSPKKQKQSKNSSHSRGKSVDLPRSTSTTSLVSVASNASFGLFGKTPKAAVPDDFISYLRTNIKPQNVEVGKIQKLRQLLRNETVAWVDEFITAGGMVELANLVYRIIDIEWREEHEDNLLHHTLTCLKALTTTSTALQQLETLHAKLFPALLALLFSSGEEKKGPAEFTTRGLIISLMFAFITASPTPERARLILSYLKDPTPKDGPVNFIAEMHRSRPYKLWFTEVSNVSKEVFWIFLHKVNIIEYPQPVTENVQYNVAHFPGPRPPVPAAPYVGSVEWDATIYLATHLDLLNGIIASLSSPAERNHVRTELRDSGFEKVMGGTLRLCKEKFYGHVHAGLSTWAGAARADGWDSKDVREGPRRDMNKRARSASPKKADKAPMLDMPKLDFESAAPLSSSPQKGQSKFDAWL